MRFLVLGAATVLVAAASASPAEAQLAAAPSATSIQPGLGDGGPRDDRRDRRRRGDTAVILDFGHGGSWAANNNRSFEPDSYNDWWHERTDRSYPRWIQNNGNCERRWYGGDTLRC